jgi:hypothetical protein
MAGTAPVQEPTPTIRKTNGDKGAIVRPKSIVGGAGLSSSADFTVSVWETQRVKHGFKEGYRRAADGSGSLNASRGHGEVPTSLAPGRTRHGF